MPVFAICISFISPLEDLFCYSDALLLLSVYCLSLHLYFLTDQISCRSFVGSVYRMRFLAGFWFLVNSGAGERNGNFRDHPSVIPGILKLEQRSLG